LQKYPEERRHYTGMSIETITEEGLRFARDADFC
jgi:hypothetical protein